MLDTIQMRARSFAILACIPTVDRGRNFHRRRRKSNTVNKVLLENRRRKNWPPYLRQPTYQSDCNAPRPGVVVNTPAGTLDVIDTATHEVQDRVNVGIDPVSVAIRPDGKEIWVSNHISDSVSVVDIDPTSPLYLK